MRVTLRFPRCGGNVKTSGRLSVVLAFTLLAVVAVSASPMSTETFSISGLDGPLTGNTYTGSFSWDPTSCCALTAFTSNFPGANGITLAQLSAAYTPYATNPAGLEAFYAPAPVGNTNAFGFFGNSPLFTYGTTVTVDNLFVDDGSGTVTYGPITTSPEPGTLVLLASGLIAAAGAARRRLSA